ncbi:BnaCnng35680D [Brassica napus]|uniref:Uncharacterized protein n=2 Tax=Brassica TaxID=3705 RepID=A0A3P6EBI8_BRAOL|nr:unnamed protein product [Brassica napus]CDY60062.1 BnaCnng35680D [Brassica napus]VDD31505.1 unnamed protein product [Brassica oleracea]
MLWCLVREVPKWCKGGDFVYGVFIAVLRCSSRYLSLFSAVCIQISNGAVSTWFSWVFAPVR